MTRPRIVKAGRVLGLTRRSTRRHYVFHPDESRHIEQAYWYCMGYAAQEYGVAVHAACLMSTHSHVVITDTRGELSRFLHRFHMLMARCTKAIRGWPAEVFDTRQTSEVHLRNPEAMIDWISYLIANPVQGLAVRYAKDWPGAQTLPKDIGRRTIRVKRPPFYFDPESESYPEVIELPLQMPAALQVEYGEELARERIAKRLREREHRAWRKAKRTGVSFVGPGRLRKMAHTKRASSYEDFGGLNPRFSVAGDQEEAAVAVRELRAFKTQYEQALLAWMAGNRKAVFPEGTWWMRVHHGARCGPAP